MSAFILIANKNTVLKLGKEIETRQSAELPTEKIQSIEKGEDLGIEEILKEKDNHALCKLQAGAGVRSLFIPDWSGWPEIMDNENSPNYSLSIIHYSLPKVPTLGASVQTAKQDGLRVSGAIASHAMAKTDWPRLEKYFDRFQSVADKTGVPVAVLLAIASRESRGGNVLQNGWGDRNNAYGWMQVDKRFHKLQGLDHPCSVKHLEQAIAIWLDFFNQIKAKFPNWETEYHIKAAFCAYNAGIKVVDTKGAMNRGTTANDYGDDCVARSQYYLSVLKDKKVAPVVDATPSKTDTEKSNNAFIQKQIGLLEKYLIGEKLQLELPTKFFSQRDNLTQPHRTCNSSSNAMYLDWLLRVCGRQGLNTDNDYIQKVLDIGDTIYHDIQTQVIQQYGFKTIWMTDKSFSNIRSLIESEFPIVVNILHRGTRSKPSGGHVILLVGRYEEGWIAHDPYGTLTSKYSNPNGQHSKISDLEFNPRWQGGYRILA